MSIRSNRVLASALVLIALISFSFALYGCGSSAKDQALEMADKFEALVDKTIEKLKEKKDAKDMQGMAKVMEEFQKESAALTEEFKNLKGDLSEKDKKEVEQRFEKIVQKMTKMFTMQ